jgi:hypothetical protein
LNEIFKTYLLNNFRILTTLADVRGIMKRKIRQTVLIETEQISILFDRSKQDFMFCPKCEVESVMLLPEKIAELTNVSIREIYRRIESGEVHFIEKERILVCLESLLNQEN